MFYTSPDINLGTPLLVFLDIFPQNVQSFLYLFIPGSMSLSLVPTKMFPACLMDPLSLVADPEDCHIFYQCDLNPQPMSCGNMMFNSYRQVAISLLCSFLLMSAK